MFVRVKSSPDSPRKKVQIVASKRNGNKISQHIVRHIGMADTPEEESALRQLAEVILRRLEEEKANSLPLFPPEQIVPPGPFAKRGPRLGQTPRLVNEVRLSEVVEEQRVIEGIFEVLSPLYKDLGLDQILPGPAQKILEATVMARVANPQSKHRTAALLEQDFGITLPLDRIYRMMDDLSEQLEKVQTIVQQATLSLFPGGIDLMFFDVTTLSFETSEQDELRDFGYSKDHKSHHVQVVLALATTEQGLPVGYQLFSGATAEIKTLCACIETWKKQIPLREVVFVADRGMMSEPNLRMLEERGYQYIVGASLKKLPKDLREQVLTDTDYRLGQVEGDGVWGMEFAVEKGRRLISAFSPKRAKKDAADRDKILERLKKKLGTTSKGTLKKLLQHPSVLRFTKTLPPGQIEIDPTKVEKEARFDGMYGVITNTKLSPFEILSRYRRLWTIEAAFRITKHDLAMRPIYHFKPERIKAHVALCYLAYALLRHAQYRMGLQQHPVSVEHLRNELLSVQASIVRDKVGGGLYRIPSAMSQEAKAIYQAFGLRRNQTPTAL